MAQKQKRFLSEFLMSVDWLQAVVSMELKTMTYVSAMRIESASEALECEKKCILRVCEK